MIDLVVWDVYGTLVQGDGRAVPRNGMYDFFSRYEHVPMVAATDAPRVFVDDVLEQLDIRQFLERLYVDTDMIRVPTVQEGRYRKDLRRICRDMQVDLDNAVLISDGRTDRKEARRVGMRFIHVPHYVSRRELFSFCLIDLEDLPKYLDLRKVNPPLRVIPSETF